MKKCPTPAANEYEPDVTATSFAEPDRPPACHICVPAPSGAFPAIENALPESQHRAVVEETIEDGRRHHGIAENHSPFPDGAVARHQHTPALIAP